MPPPRFTLPPLRASCTLAGLSQSFCKCVNPQKQAIKVQNLQEQSRLCTYGSACGREQGLVYMFLIQKARSARADTSQPGRPQHRTPMIHCQSGETSGSWRSSPFCPNKRGGARKTSSANLLFKQFLNKMFWVC